MDSQCSTFYQCVLYRYDSNQYQNPIFVVLYLHRNRYCIVSRNQGNSTKILVVFSDSSRAGEIPINRRTIITKRHKETGKGIGPESKKTAI
jgi:hypothetical protein